jgi:hypothetical protein
MCAAHFQQCEKALEEPEDWQLQAAATASQANLPPPPPNLCSSDKEKEAAGFNLPPTSSRPPAQVTPERTPKEKPHQWEDSFFACACPFPIFHQAERFLDQEKRPDESAVHALNALVQSDIFTMAMLEDAQNVLICRVNGYVLSTNETHYSIDDMNEALRGNNFPIRLEEHGLFLNDEQNRQRKKLSECDALVINNSNQHWITIYKSETGLFWNLDCNRELPELIVDIEKELAPHTTVCNGRLTLSSMNGCTVYVAVYDKQIWPSLRPSGGFHREESLLFEASNKQLRTLLIKAKESPPDASSKSVLCKTFVDSAYYTQMKEQATLRREHNSYYCWSKQFPAKSRPCPVALAVRGKDPAADLVATQRLTNASAPTEQFNHYSCSEIFDGLVSIEQIGCLGASVPKDAGTEHMHRLYIFKCESNMLKITMDFGDMSFSHLLKPNYAVKVPPGTKYTLNNMSRTDDAIYISTAIAVEWDKILKTQL